jgi:hypothetical protein
MAIAGLVTAVALRVATMRVWLTIATLTMAVVGVLLLFQTPVLQHYVIHAVRAPAVSHLSNVFTTGYGYHLLDAYFYSRWVQGNDLSLMTFDETLRYIGRAYLSFALTPLPWEATSPWALAFLPQQLCWIAAVLLGVVGVTDGARRDTWATCVLCGYSIISAGVISMASGNIGTFIRMRDMVVPFVLCLSALGFCVVTARVASRYHRTSVTL